MVKKATAKKIAAKKSVTKKTVARKVASPVSRPWTKDDVRALKAHSKARTPVAKVSGEMKRTVGALRRKAGILGVPLGEQRRR